MSPSIRVLNKSKDHHDSVSFTTSRIGIATPLIHRRIVSAISASQATSIRVLQLRSSLVVSPSGMFVFYISVVCDNAPEGKKSLQAAIDGLFSLHTNETENKELNPTLLWSALYIQDLIEGSVGPVVMTPTPYGNLNYNDLLDATSKMFKKLCPNDEFFPETSSTDSYDKLDDNSECILREDLELIKRKGLAVVDCSWARLDDVPFIKLKCAYPRLSSFQPEIEALCKKVTTLKVDVDEDANESNTFGAQTQQSRLC